MSRLRFYQCVYCNEVAVDQEAMLEHMMALHPEETVDATVRNVLQEVAEISELKRIWRLTP